MVKLRITAGILGLLSLVLPFSVSYASGSGYHYFELDWLPFWVNFFKPSYGGMQVTKGFLTSFGHVDLALTAVGIILILAGAIILMASTRHSRVGGVLLFLGFIAIVGDYGYDEIKYGLFTFIPVGMVIAFVGGILGMVAKPEGRKSEVSKSDPAERLQKLKSLKDGGIISEEEFAAQKKIILEEMKQS